VSDGAPNLRHGDHDDAGADPLRSSAQLNMLHSLAAKLNALDSVEAIGGAITGELRTIVEYHNCRVYLLQPDGRTLMPIAFRGEYFAEYAEYAEETLEELVTAVGEGMTGWVAQTGRTLLTPNAQEVEFAIQIEGTDDITESMLLVPTKVGDRVNGVIVLSSLGYGKFDARDQQAISTDNDGLWTAMYVAAESFRFKVTGDPAARDNARRGMQAIVRLEEITGRRGFPARSFIRAGEDIQPQDGEWHDTPDRVWRWKGDTSSDEIVGHYFVYPIYIDLAADEREKPALRAVIDRITNHILDNKYQLIDVDGKRTRWGWWAPELIWEDADETGLRALHMLSHLRVAMSLTADAANRKKFRAAYHELAVHQRYAQLIRNQKIMVPGHINHSDDELAFLSFYPLLRYETDRPLLDLYKESLERSWQIERPERNPLWNVIYAAGTGAKEFDREESLRTLREIPMDQIEWSVANSHRTDVPVDPLADRFKRRQALVVLPYDELPMSKWNGNPYGLDGGNGGRSEDDGAYFLLPYWMGRFHGLFDD
jgi:putative methionine-R-sulfoxide reductase with GAF domain